MAALNMRNKEDTKMMKKKKAPNDLQRNQVSLDIDMLHGIMFPDIVSSRCATQGSVVWHVQVGK